MIVKEAVYGEQALRWTYETWLGRLCLESVVKRPLFSALYGRWADRKRSAREIAPFIERFRLDPSEFVDSPDDFKTFNEFFYRRLRPEVRPTHPDSKSVAFPADGRHLLVPDLSAQSPIWAKGRRLPLADLLGSTKLASKFSGGSALISRLCPTDYHRFHFPLGGFAQAPRLLGDWLYSVNPIALRRNLNYLIENKRMITEITDSPVGDYLFLEVGATNVGSICQSIEAPAKVDKGMEKGYFKFGGSMTILIFPGGTFQASEDLVEFSDRGIEVYARCGDSAGEVVSHR